MFGYLVGSVKEDVFHDRFDSRPHQVDDLAFVFVNGDVDGVSCEKTENYISSFSKVSYSNSSKNKICIDHLMVSIRSHRGLRLNFNPLLSMAF